ncbi:type II toxin-antitoxin system HicB family antitoxin [Patescibacteria group bacterium]|nr:type II toxin-antitoxin system HicB family antitoxin [Patescibacteria group bacterium]
MVKTKKLKILQYNAVFQEEKDGGFSVWVPSLPGCCSQGDNLEHAANNIKEAISLYIEESPNKLQLQDESQEKQFLIPIRVAYA